MLDAEFPPFEGVDQNPAGFGLTVLDHMTHNVYYGNMEEWGDFYENLFSFYEVRNFDIKGRQTGLISRAMTAPNGRISIPINESADPKSQINEYLDKGIAVRYVLYPRNGPASRAWSTSEEVWCARNRNEALTAAKLDRSFETAKCDASMVSTHYTLGRDIGLSGTPAIVFEDGTLVGGYVPAAQLSMRLEQAALN